MEKRFLAVLAACVFYTFSSSSQADSLTNFPGGIGNIVAPANQLHVIILTCAETPGINGIANSVVSITPSITPPTPILPGGNCALALADLLNNGFQLQTIRPNGVRQQLTYLLTGTPFR